LDEPVSALDPVLGLHALQTMQEEARRRGATMVVSLHDVRLARARFTRLIGLRHSTVFFDLSQEQVTDERLDDLYVAESPTMALDDTHTTPSGFGLGRCF
jgi:phosphonate transport system ATP-binding protein